MCPTVLNPGSAQAKQLSIDVSAPCKMLSGLRPKLRRHFSNPLSGAILCSRAVLSVGGQHQGARSQLETALDKSGVFGGVLATKLTQVTGSLQMDNTLGITILQEQSALTRNKCFASLTYVTRGLKIMKLLLNVGYMW